MNHPYPPAQQDHLRLTTEDHVRIEQFLRTSRYLGVSGGQGRPEPPCEGPGTLPWALSPPHECAGAVRRADI